MIDIHILHLPEREAWLQECLKTLEHPACTVHVLPAVDPHRFGEGRANGYAQGTQPFVLQVGDDDFALPGAWDALVKAIKEYPNADYFQTQYYKLFSDRAMSAGLKNNKKRPLNWIAQKDFAFPACDNLAVYRRTIVDSLKDELSQQSFHADGWLQKQIKDRYPGVFIPCHYFVWRSHENSLHQWIKQQ